MGAVVLEQRAGGECHPDRLVQRADVQVDAVGPSVAVLVLHPLFGVDPHAPPEVGEVGQALGEVARLSPEGDGLDPATGLDGVALDHLRTHAGGHVRAHGPGGIPQVDGHRCARPGPVDVARPADRVAHSHRQQVDVDGRRIGAGLRDPHPGPAAGERRRRVHLVECPGGHRATVGPGRGSQARPARHRGDQHLEVPDVGRGVHLLTVGNGHEPAAHRYRRAGRPLEEPDSGGGIGPLQATGVVVVDVGRQQHRRHREEVGPGRGGSSPTTVGRLEAQEVGPLGRRPGAVGTEQAGVDRRSRRGGPEVDVADPTDGRNGDPTTGEIVEPPVTVGRVAK